MRSAVRIIRQIDLFWPIAIHWAYMFWMNWLAGKKHTVLLWVKSWCEKWLFEMPTILPLYFGATAMKVDIIKNL